MAAAEERKVITTRVYIVIVTYNAARWIEGCLRSIEPQLPLSQVIIVDNGSTDDTASIVAHFGDIVYLPQNKNLGSGGGNNLGAKVAMERDAEFVFLLNQDTRLRPGCIDNLLQVLLSNAAIALASPLHLNTAGDGLDFKFESYITARTCPGLISGLAVGKLRPYYEITFVNAAGWMLRTKVIREIGLFSSEFFHYGEDSNFLKRLRFFKHQVVLVPTAFMHHDRDERKGQMTAAHRAREIQIKKMNILLDINESLPGAYLKIFRFSGHLLMSGKIKRSLQLFSSSLIAYPRIRRVREEFKTGGFIGEQSKTI